MRWKSQSKGLRSVFFLACVLLLPLIARSEEPFTVFFHMANEKYDKGDFKGAITGYERIVNAGYESASVYFNLGNAFYKAGDIPSALLYYEKAHKLSPGDEDVRFNIRLANERTTDKIESVPEFFLTRWWTAFILSLSMQTLAFLSILLLVAGFLLLIVYLFGRSETMRRRSFYSGLTLILIGVLSVFVAEKQDRYFASHREGIVFAHSLEVKSAPSSVSREVFVIHEGTKVSLAEESGGWVRIRLSNGNEGWVEASAVKTI